MLLRPVVENAVLPVLAYVGGPGEISYFAQLYPLFREFGMEPPILYPRLSATLVETHVRRLLAKLSLDRADLVRPRHELATVLARRSLPEGVAESIRGLEAALIAGYGELAEQAGDDPPLRDALGALRNRSLGELAAAEKKIVTHTKRRNAEQLQQLDRVIASLRPDGAPQERVLNVFSYLPRYGLDLVRDLRDCVDLAWLAEPALQHGAAPG